MKVYYVVKGWSEELGIAELKALLETYGENTRELKCYTMICVADTSSLDNLYRVARRASSIREVGLLLGVDNPYEPELPFLDKALEFVDRVRWIKPSVFRYTEREAVVKYTEEVSRALSLPTSFKPASYLHLMFSEGLVFVGYPLAEQDRKSIAAHKPSARPFFRSIALPPQFSRLLVNLARVKEGDTLLDPFVGTGSILIEAGSMGIRGIGVDIDWKLALGARTNLEYYGLKNQVVILGDSTTLEYVSIDGVATDPPYGRAASTHGAELRDVYSGFILRSSRSVKRGGYIVFMSPLALEDFVDEEICRSGLVVKGKHYMYVHGGLTRMVYEVYKP